MKSANRSPRLSATPLLVAGAILAMAGTGAFAQAGGGTTSTLSPPAGEADSKLVARCNQLADTAEMRGKPRDTWIAGCIKRKGKPEQPAGK